MTSYRGVNICSAKCLNSVLNVKAVVGTFSQEKVLPCRGCVVKSSRRFVEISLGEDVRH